MSRFYDPAPSGSTVAIVPPRRLDNAEADTVAHAFTEAECPTRLGGAVVNDQAGPVHVPITPGAHGEHGRFAWSEQEKDEDGESTKVWVYVFIDGMSALLDDAIELTSTDRGLDLEVRSPSGPTRTLHLDFRKHVRKVTMKRKGDKLTLTLYKLRTTIQPWSQLQRERANAEPLDV